MPEMGFEPMNSLKKADLESGAFDHFATPAKLCFIFFFKKK